MYILVFNELTKINDEFKPVIKSCEIVNACAAIDDQPTVHKESKQVPGIKTKSYILASFPNTLTCSGINHAKKCSMVLNKVKRYELLKRLETHAIAGKLNAGYISEAVYQLTKGQKKLSQGSNVSPCLALL